MALDSLTLYCTEADVRRVSSSMAVDLRLDDDGDGTVSGDEALALQDALIDATETINFYCWQKYSPLSLSRSNFINRRASVLAAYVLSRRRDNPAPEALETSAEKAIEELESVCVNGKLLPGVPLRRTLGPSWSNTRCVPGYTFRVIRVERNTSSRDRTAKPVVPDYREQYTIEL